MKILSAADYKRYYTKNLEFKTPDEWKYEKSDEMEFLDEDDIISQNKTLISATPSQFVEFAVKMPSKKSQKSVPFSFKGREYLKLPYDTPSKRTLYKCGRQ